MNLRAWALLVALATGIQDLYAVPHTRIDPYASLEGGNPQERFGEEVGCSAPVPELRNRSVVAVAAPSANGGTGAVYLYDPSDGGVPLQILAPTSDGMVSQFGSAVEFIDDVNGDGVDDLVIGAPGTSAQIAGKLYAFVSTHQEGALRFTQCGVLSDAGGFAEKLHAIRAAGGESDVRFVVGVPSESRIVGYDVSVQSDGVCLFSQGNSFTAAGEAAGRFGDGLGQIRGAVANSQRVASLGVVAPHQGSSGSVSVLEAVVGGHMFASLGGEVVSVPHALRGSSIGTHYGSELFAIGDPAELSARGLVSVYSAGNLYGGPICSKAVELSDPSSAFGRAVIHLGDTFTGLVGEASAAFAVSKSEFATGGSLAIFGVTPQGSCGELMELNNCRYDPYQEQGSAIVGGDSCQTEHSGGVRRIMVVGSPGWAGSRGRVDIYLEGTEQQTPRECQNHTTASVSTSIPEASVTARPSSGVIAVPETSVTVLPTQAGNSGASPTPVVGPTGSTPSDPLTPAPILIDTPTSISTQMPLNTATANPGVEPTEGVGSEQTPTQTPSPTPTEELSEDEGGISEPTPHYSPTATSTSRQDDDVASVQDDPPIPVFPDALGLPTPEVAQIGTQVQVTMPVVRPELSASAQKKAARTLMKRGRLTRKRAQAILADPSNLVVTYILTYSEVVQRARFSFIQSAHADDGRRKRSSKMKRVRSRSNRVTLARLQPGVTYRVSYQVEIAVRRPRAVLGITKASAVAQFVYGAS
jgi:hypothetical protein